MKYCVMKMLSMVTTRNKLKQFKLTELQFLQINELVSWNCRGIAVTLILIVMLMSEIYFDTDVG